MIMSVSVLHRVNGNGFMNALNRGIEHSRSKTTLKITKPLLLNYLINPGVFPSNNLIL